MGEAAPPRLVPYSPKHPCYFCGAPGPSYKEHVPPKALFKGEECDSITVPSCPEHNHGKSFSDKAMLAAFATAVSSPPKSARPSSSAEGQQPNKGVLRPEVAELLRRLDEVTSTPTARTVRVSQRLADSFDEVSAKATRKDFAVESVPVRYSDLVFVRSGTDIANFFRHVTAGLVWSVVGRHLPEVDWLASGELGPFFWPQGSADDPLTVREMTAYLQLKFLIDDSGAWSRGWSAYPKPYPPDVYRFDVSLDATWPGGGANTVFRHFVLNGAVRWYVAVSLPGVVRDAVQTALRSWSSGETAEH